LIERTLHTAKQFVQCEKRKSVMSVDSVRIQQQRCCLLALLALLASANAYTLVQPLASTVQHSSRASTLQHSSRASLRRPCAAISMKAAGAPAYNNAELWGQTRTRELWQAVGAGELRKRDFTNALATRLGAKALNLTKSFSTSTVDKDAASIEAGRMAQASSAISVPIDASDVSSIEAGWR
jgi:hypothetical protein